MPEQPSLDPRRRFTGSQRAALFLAADGDCTTCGTKLEAGWHSDHVDPHTLGGPTDVVNGQALCPTCNLKKGSTPMTELRGWQRDASAKFFAHEAPDFLLSATPGAGKTTFALTMARRLIDDNIVERIIVVVPTDALRQQWADNAAPFGLNLQPVADATDYDKAGYHGCVVTYAQLASAAGADLARRAARQPTFAITDEIHHAGTSRSWGDALIKALEPSVRRLALTGTPWRRNTEEPIPYVTYEVAPGEVHPKVKVDFAYEYGDAVADGVCRRIEFYSYDGEAHWMDPGRAARIEAGRKAPAEGKPAKGVSVHFAAQLSADMLKVDVSAALEAVYDPKYQWMPKVLDEANVMLDELREEVPDAAGLVIADTQSKAIEYAKILEKLTGQAPPVVISDPTQDPGSKRAKDDIGRFRKGKSKWIVAVRMISEGVDIPRLAVGVFASKIQSPLFFRQVVGRFVRVRPDEDLTARLLIPCVPELITHARDIEEELRHQLDVFAQMDNGDFDSDGEGGGGGQLTLSMRETVAASEATFDRAISGGEEHTPEDIEAAKAYCLKQGLPIQHALKIVPLIRQQRTGPQPVASVQVDTPRFRREKMLRQALDGLVGRLARRYSTNPPRDLGEKKKAVNAELLRQGFPQRKVATVEQLEAMCGYLAKQLGR